MRFIWKKYDSSFNPQVALVGLGSLLVGAYGTAELAAPALRYPILWIFVPSP
jgi:hypothetical protein